jgi:hypothetical protein
MKSRSAPVLGIVALDVGVQQVDVVQPASGIVEVVVGHAVPITPPSAALSAAS